MSFLLCCDFPPEPLHNLTTADQLFLYQCYLEVESTLAFCVFIEIANNKRARLARAVTLRRPGTATETLRATVSTLRLVRLLELVSEVKMTFKTLKPPGCGRSTTKPLKWILDVHARAKGKVWPFNTPEAPETDEWYYDGERYRRRGEETQRTEQEKSRQTAHRESSGTREHDGQQHTPSVKNNVSEATSQRIANPSGWGFIHLVLAGEKLLFEEVSHIGSGGEGEVYLYVTRQTGHKVAVKVLDVDMIRGQCRMPHEYVVLKKHLNREPHPNILRVHACYIDNRSAEALVAMEYCAGGSMANQVKRLQRSRTPMSKKFLLHFIASMVEALGYLHCGLRYVDVDGKRMVERNLDHQPVIHRDIKLDNILLRVNANRMPDVVLADFGGAQLLAETRGIFGTPGYYSPEVLAAKHTMGARELDRQSVMTPASDIYTLGVCISEILCCGRDVTHGGLGGAYDASGLADTAISFGLLQRCLSVSVLGRPSTEELFVVAGRLRAQMAVSDRE